MALQEVSLSLRCLSSLLQSALKISAASNRTITTSCGLFGKMKFKNLGINIDKYTMKPQPLVKTGGRGHDGRIWTHGVGGGAKQRYRMIDFKRTGPRDGQFLEERVVHVRYDPCRTGDIAVVAGGTRKRFILAAENMQAGDIIKTSGQVTRIAVRAAVGDAHPVGSLPVGTLVHNLEIYPEHGGAIARAAGTSAQLVRKVGDRCILRMPSKREVNVSESCMATVGRVSNVYHYKEKIGSAGRARWFGIRPQSGLKQRKTGYHGRKIKPIKAAKVYEKPPTPKASVYRFTT